MQITIEGRGFSVELSHAEARDLLEELVFHSECPHCGYGGEEKVACGNYVADMLVSALDYLLKEEVLHGQDAGRKHGGVLRGAQACT